ncbi:MOSC domain-containing protein [Candidatus Puniceispirillum marinum]|uniref:MOSC domain protein n=1 Tax=Puniceispirillum marinum (strain IMCC1322) TaxID=488538 RepID=D5BMY4_PUNMI|nr:MOSC N-terminal beta barrel domain-containing protein [Candidatus Puniceispirillum marinum]ADE40177.1 MOSC domain protein [Candidatus Puniceispirillum marinum IMCC1322]
MLVDSIWRYPVKGMSGEQIDETTLIPGQPIAGDRRYAISIGGDKVANSPAGTWFKKAHFLQLMSHEALAALSCVVQDDHLHISKDGMQLLRADLTDATDVTAVERFFSSYMNEHMPGRLRGIPKVVRLDNQAFTDNKAPWITLGGSASIDAYAAATGTTPDARRFRLNMMIKTDTAFSEAALIGKEIMIGEAHLRIVAPVGRCAAIDVDPATATRGQDTLSVMRDAFGHTDLGVFAEIQSPGTARTGDTITVL